MIDTHDGIAGSSPSAGLSQIAWSRGGELGTTPEGITYTVQREHPLHEPPRYDVTVTLPDGRCLTVGDSWCGRGAAVAARGAAARDYRERLAAMTKRVST